MGKIDPVEISIKAIIIAFGLGSAVKVFRSLAK